MIKHIDCISTLPVQVKKNRGFTLIELVIVIVILGILAAIGVPKYISLKDSAVESARQNAINIINSAYAICIAEHTTEPTVRQLGNCISGSKHVAWAEGILLDLNKWTYEIATYKDTACITRTDSLDEKVKCLGNKAAPLPNYWFRQYIGHIATFEQVKEFMKHNEISP